MILVLYFLALVACEVLAAPTTSSQSRMSFVPTQNTTNTSLYPELTQYNASYRTVPFTPPLSVASTLTSNVTDTISSQLFTVVSRLFFNVSSFSPPSTSFILHPTSTILVTRVATAFEKTTVPSIPSSTTIITAVVTTTATSTATTSSPSWEDRTLWTAPAQMTDLSAFNITYFPSGQHNLHIVAQIPAQAIAPTAKSLQAPIFPSKNITTPSAIIQLVYPAHSVNPGSKPGGGADFYASPLNLAGLRNVTLEYSVFFPADSIGSRFIWYAPSCDLHINFDDSFRLIVRLQEQTDRVLV